MCKQILIVLSILIAFGCADDPQNQQASCGERLPEEEKLRSASIPDNATTPGENESASDVDETEPSHISYRVTEFKAYDIRHLRWVGGPDNITHIQADNSGWSQNNGRFFVDFEFYHQFDPAYPQSCIYETDTSGKKAWRFIKYLLLRWKKRKGNSNKIKKKNWQTRFFIPSDEKFIKSTSSSKRK